MKISMIIQYTILFSLHSLSIEAAISSTSGSIRGSSSSSAVDDSIVGGSDGHRHESELLNFSSTSNNDSHRLLQIATDVSIVPNCMMIQYVNTSISCIV